ncbi:DUF2478 domain-containing protein [Telmatospirillum sp.]|uniref:DUF2478 domain-containing protein n=1 Tax=Telmatospirillum sp. TaxID=2079197 RepID=UPI0028488EA2|nr:DUF2478 domain-containing protein [Telmatospirillum sp.]MDR3439807.1 DUF2478 domain-containing protein [Telmatospirillum sp.]
MDDAPLPLAAIVYRRGAPLEETLTEIRNRLAARGDLRLGGVMPRWGAPLSNGRNSLLLDDIGRGDTIVISQDLGPGSTGCILDADGLARAQMRISEAIRAKPDILFLGRFAKEELAGRGIREEIGEAMIAGIPSIVAVEERSLTGWIDFVGDSFVVLPAEVEAIIRWIDGQIRAGSAP